MAIIGQKKRQLEKRVNEVENEVQLESTITQKTVIFNSSCTLLSF